MLISQRGQRFLRVCNTGIAKTFTMSEAPNKQSANIFDSSRGKAWDDKLNHLFEESAALNVYDKTKINLAAGCPSPEMLKPLAELTKKAVEHRMTKESAENYYLFQYGPTAGLWGMRQALSEFLTKRYGSTVHRENLIMTCGATQGLHLLLSTVLAEDGVIFVEEFTYMISLQIFKEFPNYKIVQVPLTSDGVDVDEFYKIVNDTKNKATYKVSAEKPFWAFFYTIPNFHNPTGTLLPPKKCESLVKAARDMDLLIVCDDVYNLFYYGDDAVPPARLYSYDDPESEGYKGGNVVSNGSFSKILAPGFRVGWMEVPMKLATRFRQCGILQSGGSVNNVMFGVVQSFLELGFLEKQLNWYLEMYKIRIRLLCEVFDNNLPKGCEYVKPQGGYFLWLKVPVDSADFLSWSIKNGGPSAVPSIRFTLSSMSASYSKDTPMDIEFKENNASSALRISIAFHDAETLKMAATDMCEKLKQYIKLKE